MVKHHESPYLVFSANPVWFGDNNGADTVIVNKEGNVIYNNNDGTDLLFHNYGNSDKDFSKLRKIPVNDPKMDTQQLNAATVGSKLVRFLDYDNVNWMMDKAGVDKIHIQTAAIVAGGAIALLKAYGNLDFAGQQLAPNLLKDYPGIHPDDDYSFWDNNGGFVVFQGTGYARAFNIPDAGNFLFGVAAGRLGVLYTHLKIGSQTHELIKGGWDSTADQVAVRLGYKFAAKLKLIHSQQFLIPQFNDYTKSKPSWFDE